MDDLSGPAPDPQGADERCLCGHLVADHVTDADSHCTLCGCPEVVMDRLAAVVGAPDEPTDDDRASDVPFPARRAMQQAIWDECSRPGGNEWTTWTDAIALAECAARALTRGRVGRASYERKAKRWLTD